MVGNILTTGQCAKLCGVTPRDVAKWFDSGRLRGYRIPGSQDRRVPKDYLLRFLREQGMPIPAELTEQAEADPWPTKDVIAKLIEAAEILLHQHNYDGHGYEEITAAVERAKQIISE